MKLYFSLTKFKPPVSFYTPWKQKMYGFLLFSGSINWGRWTIIEKNKSRFKCFLKVLQNLVFVVVSVGFSGFSEFICCAVRSQYFIMYPVCFQRLLQTAVLKIWDKSYRLFKKTKAKNPENFLERSRFYPSRRLYGNRANMT